MFFSINQLNHYVTSTSQSDCTLLDKNQKKRCQSRFATSYHILALCLDAWYLSNDLRRATASLGCWRPNSSTSEIALACTMVTASGWCPW